MACSCCAFGDTADQHFHSEKVAKELRKYRRKDPGVTTRRLRDGLVAAGLTQGRCWTLAAVLALSAWRCSTQGWSARLSSMPRLRISLRR
jgi:hypothetical protein